LKRSWKDFENHESVTKSSRRNLYKNKTNFDLRSSCKPSLSSDSNNLHLRGNDENEDHNVTPPQKSQIGLFLYESQLRLCCHLCVGQDQQSPNWKNKRKQWNLSKFSVLSMCLIMAILLSCIVVFMWDVHFFSDGKVKMSSSLRRFKQLDDKGNHVLKGRSPPSSLLYHLRSLSDLSESYDHTKETPFFLQVTLTGESVAKRIFSHCYNLVQACELGRKQPQYNEDMLETFTVPPSFKVAHLFFNATYINVDVSTSSGLRRAADLNLVSSDIADVISSPSLYETTNALFTEENRARLFSFFRHPIDLAVGWYNHISHATWDHVNYSPDVKSMTLAEYASSSYIVDNPITRMLTIGPDDDHSRALTKDDLKIAKEIVQRKCLVGLYRDRLGSMARFGRYFSSGWNHRWESIEGGEEEQQRKILSCRKKVIQKGDKTMNHGLAVEMGSEEWELLTKVNELDLELYQHIEKLYEIQGKKIFDVV